MNQHFHAIFFTKLFNHGKKFGSKILFKDIKIICTKWYIHHNTPLQRTIKKLIKIRGKNMTITYTHWKKPNYFYRFFRGEENNFLVKNSDQETKWTRGYKGVWNPIPISTIFKLLYYWANLRGLRKHDIKQKINEIQLPH